MSTSSEIALGLKLQNTFDDKINICSGNSLVSSGNKPLPEPKSTQSYTAIWHHYAIMSEDQSHISLG